MKNMRDCDFPLNYQKEISTYSVCWLDNSTDLLNDQFRIPFRYIKSNLMTKKKQSAQINIRESFWHRKSVGSAAMTDHRHIEFQSYDGISHKLKNMKRNSICLRSGFLHTKSHMEGKAIHQKLDLFALYTIQFGYEVFFKRLLCSWFMYFNQIISGF